MVDEDTRSGDPGRTLEPAGRNERNERNETEAQRLDRNWNELLQELRVAQTGAQILAAFLLTVPFQQRFTELSDPQVLLYLGSLALGTLTTGLLVAPAAWHRSSFRQGRKAALVTFANVSAQFGLLCLSLTVACTLALVFWVTTDHLPAIIAGVATIVVLVGGWFVVPLVRLRRRD